MWWFVVLVTHVVGLRVGSYTPIEYPPANFATDWKNDCQDHPEVSVYAYDFGWDQHVVTLLPGETHSMSAHLGHQYFAVSPDSKFLGNFTVHWDENRPPTSHGASRHFVIVCPTEECTIDKETNTCLNDPTKKEALRPPRPYKGNADEQINIAQRKYNLERWEVNKVAGLVKKFTPVGFKTGLKMKDVSPEGWKLILKFYAESKDTKKEVPEIWDAPNIYVNHHEVPITVMHLPGSIKEIIWRDLSIALGEWVGMDPKELVGSSVYGIRRYWRGGLLRNHGDRVELVLSAIINVDGDMEEPWPLQIYSHDGRSHIVFMEPGDVIFYESASCIHGRPLPLNGTFMANIFAHTKPINWPLKEKNDIVAMAGTY